MGNFPSTSRLGSYTHQPAFTVAMIDVVFAFLIISKQQVSVSLIVDGCGVEKFEFDQTSEYRRQNSMIQSEAQQFDIACSVWIASTYRRVFPFRVCRITLLGTGS